MKLVFSRTGSKMKVSISDSFFTLSYSLESPDHAGMFGLTRIEDCRRRSESGNLAPMSFCSNISIIKGVAGRPRHPVHFPGPKYTAEGMYGLTTHFRHV